MASKPSVIFMGKKPASVVALSILLERGWDVRYVVVPRSLKLDWYGGRSLEELATAHCIKVVSQAELPRDKPVDYVISYMFGNLVKVDVIALATRAAINFHAAPLPRFGGWAFYNLAILENVSIYGCSCHHMDESFDTGPLLEVRHFPINAEEETAYSLEARAQEEMIGLFIDVCHLLETRNEIPCHPQDRTQMRYLNLKQMEALKEIPANADEGTIERYARAFWYPPYEGAYIRFNGLKVEVVPKIAKEKLGVLMHAGDLTRLQHAARCYVPRSAQGEQCHKSSSGRIL